MYQLLMLVGIGILILWIITPFMVFRLSSRVRRLEALASASPASAPVNAVASADREIPASHTSELGATEKFFAWVKEDWLLKMGGLLLLIGFGWLATYAFLNNWIGPMGRIGLGIIAGTAILILGTWRIRTHVHQGGVFLVVGSTTILLTIFAAREIYEYFTPGIALGIMFLSVAYVALVSVKFNSRALSLASVILAGIAPLLTNAPVPNFTALFAYLLVVVLGTVWIVAVTNQRGITAAALLLVSVYSVPHLLSPAPAGTLLLFAYAFSAVFFLTNTTGIVKLRDKNIVPDMLTAAGNGLFLLAWIMTKAPDVWRSLIISAWMLAFVAGAFIVFTMTKKREPLYVYAGVGVAMLAAATAAELSGAALTIAFTVEVGMISCIAYALLHDRSLSERLCLLFIGPVALSFQSLESSAWSRGVLHEDFFVLLILAVILMGIGVFYARVSDQGKPHATPATSALLIVGSLYAFALLWLSLHAMFASEGFAVMIALLIYTIIGLVTYFFGRVHGKKGLGLYGGTLLGFVIARLLLVDIWDMPLTIRIITFFVVGILLMGTAFFGRGKAASPAQP